jgi:hypothetical protein
MALGAGLLGAAGSGASALVAPAAALASTIAPAGGRLSPVVPQRILDTRTTAGGHHAKLGGGATMKLPVLADGGVPGAGVSAVMLNITVADETASGYLTAYPGGITRPTISTLNFRAGVAIANQALVRVGSDGTISLFNSAGATDVIIDVIGWVGSDALWESGQTTTVQPTRLLDTRTTDGGHDAPLGSGAAFNLQAGGRGGIPASGVTAVYANITAIPVGASAGYLTAYATGSNPPGTSTDSFMTGVTTANMALLPVSASGVVTIANHAPRPTHVLVDIVGYTTDGAAAADAGAAPIHPTRVLDTRTTLGGHDAPIGPGGAANARVLGVGGVPSAGVAAVLVHLTATSSTNTTYLEAYGTGLPRRSSSTLNMGPGNTVSNTALVPVGTAGEVGVYNEWGNVQVTLDVEGWVAAPALNVVAPTASAAGAGTLTSPDGKIAASVLNNANKYALTTWWNTIYPSLAGADTTSAAVIASDDVPALAYSAATVNATDAVRRLAMEAFSLATSISTGAYNPTATGVPLSTAISRTAAIINSVTTSHLANRPGGWGENSETMFWAAYAGTAAWLLWSHLSPALQSEVAKMVYLEADYGTDQTLQFYANAAGTILTPGDTGADPDSWDPMAAQLAAVMLPGNPHVALWDNAIARDALVAWARPSDVNRTTVVNGNTVAAWLGNRGSNALSSGAVVNHNRVAPDYMTLIYQNMQEILVTAMAGQAAPLAITSLVGPVYESYTSTSYSSPPWDSPGGTIYRPSSASIYWPQVPDWGAVQYVPFAVVDAEIKAFDGGSATDLSYEERHAQAELNMQAAHADGHTYDSNSQYNYVGREEHVSQLAAQLYLTDYVRDHSLAHFTSASYWLAP